MELVPNRHPTLPSSKICIVGEAPGREEQLAREPFVGPSGRFLAALLTRAGTTREACLIANVCQHKPPGNNLASFSWMGDEIQSGIAKLQHDIQVFQTNVIVTLGNVPLHLLKNGNVPPRYVSKGIPSFKFPDSVFNWRGSLIRGAYGKTVPTVHPAYVLRDYSTAPLLALDLKKAVRESRTNDFCLPE